ncbi:hypothetical protein KEM55_003877 [Ascosphaera atra]|nr:hypothetical protein KEM55_003877 [Ascosphaera atra]
MAPSFFSSSGALSKATYFDIRLDDSYVVFRGNDQEAASAHLQGTLVLCLNEPLTIKHLRLSLTGMSRVSWHTSAANPGSRRNSREKTFFEKVWTFRECGKGRTETLNVDNYEFPFDVILDGSLPESVEGLHDTWVTYRFKAEIGRKYAKDIVVRKPLRIIRTLGPSALELAHAMSVENIWPNKIEYAISTPSKAVIFGTNVRVDFRLLPLLKGLRIGSITTQLVETHDFTVNPDDPDIFHSTHKTTRIIATDTHFLPGPRGIQSSRGRNSHSSFRHRHHLHHHNHHHGGNNHLSGTRSLSRTGSRGSSGSENTTSSEGSVDPVQLVQEAEMFDEFTRVIELPKSLSKCMQDVDVKGIKIKHKLKFRVQLHNPDGHTSEVSKRLECGLGDWDRDGCGLRVLVTRHDFIDR